MSFYDEIARIRVNEAIQVPLKIRNGHGVTDVGDDLSGCERPQVICGESGSHCAIARSSLHPDTVKIGRFASISAISGWRLRPSICDVPYK